MVSVVPLSWQSWGDSRLPGAPPAVPALSRVWYAFMTARIAIATVLLLLQISIFVLGQPISWWVFAVCIGYWLATVAVRVFALPQTRGSNFDMQWLPIIGVDLLVFSALQFVQFGNITYTPLFALPVLLAAVLGSKLFAYGTAASVTLLLLVDAWWMGQFGGSDVAARFLQAGLTGSGLFVVVLLTNQLATRLAREEQEARRSKVVARTQAQVNELVVDALGEGVLVVDRAGLVHVVNPAARRILGPAGAHLTTPFMLGAFDGWLGLADIAAGAFVNPEYPPTQVSLVYDESDEQRVQVRLRMTHGQGSDAESLCVMFLEDMRESEARARTEKLAAMGRMSAAVAHEIRNPLAAIAQANALLAEELSSPAQKQLSTMVAHNAQRLSRVVDDVLNLARPQVVVEPDESTCCVLDTTVAEFCAEWATQNASADRLLRELDTLGAVVVFEVDHLRRVLVNLLDNALRYAGTTPRSIQVSTSLLRSDRALLTVWSDGAPIEKVVEQHLFEPFFSSESRSTGLGLYICRELCDRYVASIAYRRVMLDGVPGNAFLVECRVAEAGLARRSGFGPLSAM